MFANLNRCARVVLSPLAAAVALCWTWAAVFSPACGQQAQWIWSPEHQRGAVPSGTCHFRTTVHMTEPESAEIVVAADDHFKIYVNGKLAGEGTGFAQIQKLDISSLLKSGDNVFAIQVENTEGNTAALAAQCRYKGHGDEQWRWFSTDESWKTHLSPLPLWKSTFYNDQPWKTAQSWGPFGSTRPWDNDRAVPARPSASTASARPAGGAPSATSSSLASPPSTATRAAPSSTGPTTTTLSDSPRAGGPAPGNSLAVPVARRPAAGSIKVPEEFQVQQLINGTAGSLLAMEFNEFGQLILSREGGPLLLADLPKARDGKVPVREYCKLVNSCQGILPLNGDVLVTGNGPQGLALYRLTDGNRDGIPETASALIKFHGQPGEHGPHGLTLGPDGMVYVVIGNHSGIMGSADPRSPMRTFYEGDVAPRYEDPSGHAVGIRAPGGTIVRASLDGKRVEIVAGGLRNPYDLAFNRQGELFCHESDMETDFGTPWYRPTQVYHVIPGADFGWRSGWAKFPGYYVDCATGICDTGRGSPSGAVVYDHIQFPQQYQGALFTADWSEGRILAVHPRRRGASYEAQFEEFLSGQSLPITDLAVGPDGALYFCTGGRGCTGQLFRVSWTGKPPAEKEPEHRLLQLVDAPQPQSAWGRQKLAQLKIEMGEQWTTTLQGVLREQRNRPEFRCRALDLMMLYGPLPDAELLTEISRDPSPEVRAKVAFMMGLKPRDAVQQRLIDMLADDDALVRKEVCLSLLRADATIQLEQLKHNLISADAAEALAARRVLERAPADQWRDEVLASENQQLFVQGATALLIADPSLSNAYAVLAQISEFMDGFVSDASFVQMLRVMQLAIVRGRVEPDKVPALAERVSKEFPAGNGTINREVSRLLAYLQSAEAGSRIQQYLDQSANSDEDKLLVVMHLQLLGDKLSGRQRLKLIDYLEQAQHKYSGGYRQYVVRAEQDLCATLAEEDLPQVLQNAASWPTAALATLERLPRPLDESNVAQLIDVDRSLMGRSETQVKQLQTGIIALLAEHSGEQAMQYLRDVWQRDAMRRGEVAVGLAQRPEEPNWSLLVESLPILDDETARQVISQLHHVNLRPQNPESFRQLIIFAHRLRDAGGREAIALLQHWSGQQLTLPEQDLSSAVRAWVQWFHQHFADQQPIELDASESNGRWTVSQILDHIDSRRNATSVSANSPHPGREVFIKAQCVQCHRFGNEGDHMGPDLTSISKRFSQRETVEAILFPSRVISDQFSAYKFETLDGVQYTGTFSKTPDGTYLILQSDGQKVRVHEKDVDRISRSSLSAMPDNLLDPLSADQIADLINYLYSPPTADIARLPAEEELDR